MNASTVSPAALGYRQPAEWEPHEATWIAWPHNRADWPGKFGPIPWVYVDIVRQLARFEPVRILIDSRKAERRAAFRLAAGGANLDRVEFVRAQTDRVWTRDYGPCFIRNGQPGPEGLGVVDWKFNGWAKYDDCRRDDRVARRLARRLGFKRWKACVEVEGKKVRVVLEGGAIDVNGKGAALVTEECLLSTTQCRNPRLDRQAVETVLRDYLGVTHAIWLNRGIVGDDTHGHVDDIARFVAPRTVLAAVEPDPADPNHEPLQENLDRLRAARDQAGKPLRVLSLPMPAPVIFQGERLPASYANFYIANGVVLVPTFNDGRDREALGVIASVFKDREVVGIHAVDLVWGLGTLHCLTHEQPQAGASGDPHSSRA
jgi:agmatine deiminase